MFKKTAAAYDLAYKFLQKGDVKNARIAMGIGDKFKGMEDKIKNMLGAPQPEKKKKLDADWLQQMPGLLQITGLGVEIDDLTYAVKNEVERDGHKFIVITLGVDRQSRPGYTDPLRSEFETIVLPMYDDRAPDFRRGGSYKEALSRPAAAENHREACQEADLIGLFGIAGGERGAQRMPLLTDEWRTAQFLREVTEMREAESIAFKANGHLFSAIKGSQSDHVHVIGPGHLLGSDMEASDTPEEIAALIWESADNRSPDHGL